MLLLIFNSVMGSEWADGGLLPKTTAREGADGCHLYYSASAFRYFSVYRVEEMGEV